MKYNITLNQVAMIENNLNVSQWCILDIISVAPTWCTAIVREEEIYYWVARQKISEELKSLNLKADTIYRYIKQLAELDFIEHIKDGKKDLIRLTLKGKKLFIAMSEKNPDYYVGKKSEKNSEKNPTYNNTNIHNNTNNIYSDSFEKLWTWYKSKSTSSTGDKKKANNNFKKCIKQYDINIISLGIGNYIKDCIDSKRYTKNLSTLLNEDLEEYSKMSFKRVSAHDGVR